MFSAQIETNPSVQDKTSSFVIVVSAKKRKKDAGERSSPHLSQPWCLRFLVSLCGLVWMIDQEMEEDELREM